MKLQRGWLLSVALLLGVGTLGCEDTPAPVTNPEPVPAPVSVTQGPETTSPRQETEREAIYSRLAVMGGSCDFDPSPEGPIVGVDFHLYTMIEPDRPRHGFTDAGLVHLQGLSELRSLDLDATPVTDAGLEHLKGLASLQSLCLSRTRITDAGLEYLKGLANLRWLDLSGTQITGAGLEHFKDLPNLEVLKLDGSQVTGAGLEHLKGLTNLESLFLSGTHVTEEGVERLRQALPKCTVFR